MDLGERIRAVREEKKLSQGDIEKRTGLLRCYISRVENGHTVPAIETLEKIVRALECPLSTVLRRRKTTETAEPPREQIGRLTSHGAVLVKRRVTPTSFADC